MAQVASSKAIRREFARQILFFIINLSVNLDADDVQAWLRLEEDQIVEEYLINHEMLLEEDQAVEESVNNRKRREISSIGRSLLVQAGGKQNQLDQFLACDFTSAQRTAQRARLFRLQQTAKFGDIDPSKVVEILTKHSVFSALKISDTLVIQWTKNIRKDVHLGFEEGYMNLPLQILEELTIERVKDLVIHITYMHKQLPPLGNYEHSPYLFLVWAFRFWTTNKERKFWSIIRTWARSGDGAREYNKLLQKFRGPSPMSHFLLHTAALLCYQRLTSDSNYNAKDLASKDSISHLDDLLNGQSKEDGVLVSERLVLACIRSLESIELKESKESMAPKKSEFHNELVLLGTALCCESTELDHGEFDKYVLRRIATWGHEPAYEYAISDD